jgi:hypothetical protein
MDAEEQCALDPHGNLRDASDIVWYNDKDDLEPILGSSVNSVTGG